jgi:predicted transcriptional regulator
MSDPARKTAPDEHLDDPLEHGDAWEQEIDRRIADVREGRVELLEHEDVMADIDRMLAARGVRSTRARTR